MRLLSSSILAEGSKAGLGALNFLVLAAGLGPAVFGEYVQYAALIAVLLPICSFGFNWWIQPLTKSANSRVMSSVTLIMIGVTSSCGIFAITVVSLLTGWNWHALAAVAAVELVIFPIWGMYGLGFLAMGRPRTHVFLSMSAPLVKLVGSVLIVTVMKGSLFQWGVGTAALGATAFLVVLIVCGFGPLRSAAAIVRVWLGQGVGFGAVGAASALADNVDRVVLGSFLPAPIVGVYGASARVAMYAAIPVRSAALIAYPRYFTLVERKDFVALRLTVKGVIVRSFLISLVSVASVAVGSWLLEVRVLDGYAGLFVISLILSVGIPLRSVQYAFGDVLYALGRPYYRLGGALISALLSVGMTALGALSFGMIGVAVGSVVSVGLSALIYLGLVFLLIRRSGGST